MDKLRNVAVVLAGGTGTRVGLNIPKQLIKIAGKPIIEHTIARCRLAAGRRDPRDDGARATWTRSARSSAGRLRQGQPDPRGRRDPERHHGRRARRARRGGVQRPAARRGAPARLADDHRGQRRGAADLPGRRHRDPVGRHGDPGRRPADGNIADVLPRHLLRRGQTPQSLPALDDPGRVRERRAGPELHRDRRLHRGAALPPRGADRGGGRPRAQHEGHRADRRLHRRQAVPARPRPTGPSRSTTSEYRARLEGRTLVVFGGSYGIGGDIADAGAESYGATVQTFSRSTTGTHVERRADIAEAARQVLDETGRIDFVVNTAGVLPAASSPSRPRRRSTPPPTSTTWRRSSSRRSSTRTSPRPAARCCCSPRPPTPAAGRATRSTPRPRPRSVNLPRRSPTSGPPTACG